MANQRLTKKKLKNHLAYSWWKYALAAAVSTMLVSIVFAVTEYRPPDDKKVEFYVLNSYADTETMQADFWPLLQTRKPEQEKLTAERKELSRRYLALKDEVKEAEQIRKGVYAILREENRKEQPTHKQDLDR